MKIGLALSGGGALGAAHLGVLKEIEENGIKIDRICGTSAGAIVGLLYSVGGVKTVELFYERLAKSDIFERKNLIMRRNMTTFQQIFNLLADCVGPRTFSDLNIKFSCVATNIINGEAEELAIGDPIRSVMASSAYPGVFAVQKIDDRFYIDGGLTFNLPAKVIKKDVDFTIGSSLHSIPGLKKSKEDEKIKVNLLNTAVRSIDILTNTLAAYEIKDCNFCFTPPTESFRWYDFDHINTIRKIGEKYAKDNMPELKEKLNNFKKSKRFFGLLGDRILARQ